MRPECLVRRSCGSRVRVILLVILLLVILILIVIPILIVILRQFSLLDGLDDSGSIRVRVGDFTGVSLFKQSARAVRPRVLQGAHLFDGSLDHTFLGESIVDDLCRGVLADNRRRNNNSLLLNGSLGHSVRLVHSLNISRRVYMGTS